MATRPCICCLLIVATACSAAVVGLREEKDRLTITVDGKDVATYIYRDEKTLRPYFAHVCAPNGVQVTRNHPPVKGKDPMDHATYHPGIWLAFGDINGSDFWRNKARVVHRGFSGDMATGPERAVFAVKNDYLRKDGQVICTETCRITFLVRPSGHVLLWDSTFASDKPFAFGDQEEMGLGVRVASPMRVQAGGTILDAEGRRNGRDIWGQASAWCDYSGIVDGKKVGVTLMPHRGNFRPSWFHARDYGLLVANPFGRKAFRKGESSRVEVRPGETFRLRFSVLLHGGESSPAAAYADILQLWQQ